jgi:hypothetical protein
MLRKLFVLSIVAAMTSSAAAATITGSPSDNLPTILFDANTGAVTVSPEGTPVGLFDILSDIPVFNATPANLPAGGLFTTDSTIEKAWASLGGSAAFTSNLNLGLVGLTGAQYTQDFLNQHLTITYSGGFGTPNVSGDLIVTPVTAPIMPEPATLTMIGVAMLGGLGIRRRS